MSRPAAHEEPVAWTVSHWSHQSQRKQESGRPTRRAWSSAPRRPPHRAVVPLPNGMPGEKTETSIPALSRRAAAAVNFRV